MHCNLKATHRRAFRSELIFNYVCTADMLRNAAIDLSAFTAHVIGRLRR